MAYEALTGDKLLTKAKACHKAASTSEAKQRINEREDLEFQIPENQWDPLARKYRQGTATSPGRPMLSVSLLAQPMALIQNQAVAAKLGVEIHPVSEEADPEVAEIKQGLYRRIERDSNASLARLWALDRAKQCGRGWYRINTQWDEDGDDEFDQEIVIERILNQENVYIDPAAQKPDFSDAQWALIVSYVDVDVFEEMYPKAKSPSSDSEFKAWASDDPDWVKADGKNKGVLVAEYWWKVTDPQIIKKGKREKVKENIRVRYAKLTAREVLEEQDWNGKYIPLVPVIGTELQPFDGERRWEGMVRRARDAQKFFNYSISTLVERMAMEPKAPFVGAEGQFRGHEEEWMLANVRNQPYLEYRPVSHEGTQAPPPARSQVDSSGMSVALMALDQARSFVQMSTSVYAPSLGEMPQEQSKQSGRAILALQQQSDAGTSHFLQNLANISMPYEARVVLDLMPTIYDRPGRVVQVLGAEDEPRSVMLGKPYVEKDGQPIPLPTPGENIPMPAVNPEQIKNYDLSKGKYTVSVSVGKSFQTRLQEGASEIGAILQAAPQLMPIIGPTYFRFRDFPGSKEISDLLKRVREKTMPGIDAKEGEEPSPEQLKGQLEQLGAAMKEKDAQLQAAAREIETERAKQEAAVMKAQLDAQTAMSKAQLDAETKRTIAAADNATKLEIANLSARVDEMLTLLKVQGEAYKINLQADRDDIQADKGREHEAVMGELGRPAPEEPEPEEPEEE